MPLVFGIISKNNQYDAERKNTSYTFQKDLLIFYRIPLLTSDVVWATIFRDEKPPMNLLLLLARFGQHKESFIKDERKTPSKLQGMQAFSPSSSSSPSSIRPPQKLQARKSFGHHKEEERERGWPATPPRKKRERIIEVVHLEGSQNLLFYNPQLWQIRKFNYNKISLTFLDMN